MKIQLIIKGKNAAVARALKDYDSSKMAKSIAGSALSQSAGKRIPSRAATDAAQKVLSTNKVNNKIAVRFNKISGKK